MAATLKKLIVTIGLPGSGKTTWAMAQITGHEDTVCRANRDAIRVAHMGRRLGTPAQEAIVSRAQDTLIVTSFEYGYTTVIVDDTNLHGVSRLRQLAEQVGAAFIVKEFRTVTLSTCIRRNNGRIGADRIDEAEIRRMHDEHVLPWLREQARRHNRAAQATS